MRYLVLSAALFITTLAQATALDSQLLHNGNAESGSTAGWLNDGIEVVPAVGIVAGSGNFVFTGGDGPTTQSMSQTLNVSDLSGLIDAQYIYAEFSVQLQSRADELLRVDYARVDLKFLDSSGNLLQSFLFQSIPTIPTPSWQNFHAFALLPTTTHQLQVTFTATHPNMAHATSGDGFMDQASLMLRSGSVSMVPEPSSAILVLSGAGLLSMVWRRKSEA